jgi:hypothetical protein
MATTIITNHGEEKGDMLEHVDRTAIGDEGPLSAKDVTFDATARGQGVSGYETLTLWQTVKAFKVNAAVCFAVTFSGATDGYQIGYVLQRDMKSGQCS